MSFQAMAQAVKVKTKKSSEKLILLALANYADENNQAYPSLWRLSADCCMSERSVQTNIQKLQEQGLVSTEQRILNSGRSTSNLYTLHFENAKQVEKRKKPKNMAETPENMGVQNLHPQKHGGAKSAPMGAESAPLEPITNTGSSSKRDAVAKTDDFDFDQAFAVVLGLVSKQLSVADVPEAVLEAIWLDYRTGATAPSYARSLSFMMTGIQQHQATQRRSMAVSHSRDELTSARIRHISAQKTLAERKTAELGPRDRFDTSWAEGLEILEQAE